MKKRSGLNQEKNLHRSSTVYKKSCPKQICVWILMWETTGDGPFHWRKSYYGLYTRILARSDGNALKKWKCLKMPWRICLQIWRNKLIYILNCLRVCTFFSKFSFLGEIFLEHQLVKDHFSFNIISQFRDLVHRPIGYNFLSIFSQNSSLCYLLSPTVFFSVDDALSMFTAVM